ncbi:MAG TPA: Crp/Fnr family transcriptional regulator [Desulfobacteria bacterium]|nr:Crp/Fnr family transcriptional regulator [Desulfobacteria bacterium]
MTDISKAALFEGLSGEEFEKVRKRTTERIYPKGALVFSEGEQTDGLYIVSSGLVKVFKLHTDGREKTLDILRPGQCLGEVSLFGSSIRSASVETLQPTSFLIIPSTELKLLLMETPSLAVRFIEMLSGRLREANRQIQELAFMNSRNRVICNLINLAEVHGRADESGVCIDVRLTHSEFAKLAGVSRETVTKVLQELQELSLISINSKYIKILSTSELYQEVM